MSALKLPAKKLRYWLSQSQQDHAALRAIDHCVSSLILRKSGLRIRFTSAFPNDYDQEPDDDNKDENTLAIVVGEINSLSNETAVTTSSATTTASLNTNQTIGFITVQFISWNSRLTVAGNPAYLPWTRNCTNPN
ncbi:hypothetical protein AJ79_08024 [Helicocarpus griseus UAMH5409]|uniref:Uncharacterized protein n=1 Tax=Helicocarpus griseus UAMH5409 TaxID=1447875 RepID=A0A2B7WWJ4_9EURO|nr:hypothetical protein AJ79_08024 [Helicocarpus griseus UAMH5409]